MRKLFLTLFVLYGITCQAQSTDRISVLEIHMKGSQREIAKRLKKAGFKEEWLVEPRCFTGIFAGDSVEVFVTEKKPGTQTLDTRAVKIFQVLPDGSALAHAKESGNMDMFRGPVVKLTPQEGFAYYDDLIIKADRNEEVRITGTYTYETKENGTKTVPIVDFFLKKTKRESSNFLR